MLETMKHLKIREDDVHVLNWLKFKLKVGDWKDGFNPAGQLILHCVWASWS